MYEPNERQLSLHGLGFIQMRLNDFMRIHVWHPDLPRRMNAAKTAIHTHRGAFVSTVMRGEQTNRFYRVTNNFDGPYRAYKHAPVRTPNGCRPWDLIGGRDIKLVDERTYGEGQSYRVPQGAFHETINSGKVATLVNLSPGDRGAVTLLPRDVETNRDFDRFQLSDAYMREIIMDVLSDMTAQREPEGLSAIALM